MCMLFGAVIIQMLDPFLIIFFWCDFENGGNNVIISCLFHFQALHFSPTLYDHVINEMGKHFILVLNKIDLAPPALVVAWKYYFKSKFPDLHVVTFTSIPKDEEEMAAAAPGKGCSQFCWEHYSVFLSIDQYEYILSYIDLWWIVDKLPKLNIHKYCFSFHFNPLWRVGV